MDKKKLQKLKKVLLSAGMSAEQTIEEFVEKELIGGTEELQHINEIKSVIRLVLRCGKPIFDIFVLESLLIEYAKCHGIPKTLILNQVNEMWGDEDVR
jgi:hypothetical protein